METLTDAPKIEVTNIKPGDTIILKYPNAVWMEPETAQEIERDFKSKLGKDVNVLFILGGAEVSIFRKEGSE
jgi:hypothetical protein